MFLPQPAIIFGQAEATATLECPSGKRVLSGGASLSFGPDFPDVLSLRDSHGFDFDQLGVHHSGWLVRVRNDDTVPATFQEIITCATIS